MSDYSYIPFKTIDFKNENTLSSFALKETPIKFIPNLNNSQNIRLLWDFGDGTASQSLTSTKWYDRPGQYTTTLTVFDCFSNAELSTERKIVNIFDFVDHTFYIDYDEEYDIQWKNGKINGPLIVRSYFPIYMKPSSIYYDVSGSDSGFYFDTAHLKYDHLIPTYSFFERSYNFNIRTPYYKEILEIKPVVTALYAVIEDNNLTRCLSTVENSFFVGLSGYNEIYFKDDLISGGILINLNFDRVDIPDYVGGFANNLGVTISATITENNDVECLKITSNGADGEFYPISSFNIDDFKFTNIRIPFVVKIKDSDNFSVKNFELSSIEQFSITALSSGIPLLSSIYNINEVSLMRGAVLGNITFDSNFPLYDISLSSSGNFVNDQSSSFIISGNSSTFSVYPQNYITLEKINEDFDFTETFKGLRFQEFLIDKNILFDDFIGSIFGGIDSSHDTLGKKIHEKISNFVDNNANVDKSEVYSLLSHMDLLNVRKNEFDSNRFKFPESLKRFMDIASIDKNHLIGTRNKFSQNFDIKSRTSKETFGRNIGDEIDITTYTISSGIPIVALENFSGEYVLLNTEQPANAGVYLVTSDDEFVETNDDEILLIGNVDSFSYKLSDFSTDWGWPLTLPPNFEYLDFPKYYTFFEYLSGHDDTITNNTLLPNSAFDTTPFNSILKIVLQDTLHQSLSTTK